MAPRLYGDKKWCGKYGIRLRRLRAEPLCRFCRSEGRVTPAVIVDHVVPHKGDPALFFDYENTQSLCKRHHDSTKQQQEHKGYASDVGTDGNPLDPKHPWK